MIRISVKITSPVVDLFRNKDNYRCPLYFKRGNNLKSKEFLRFVLIRLFTNRTHAQYGGCDIHPEQIEYNGDCGACHRGVEIGGNDNARE